MARAALNWTLKELADRAEINMNTISRYEGGGAMLSDTLEKIEKVFRAEGIVFIDEDGQLGPGVRLPREPKATTTRSLRSRSERTKPKSLKK
jgi:transcriptional regulator with XRE-family HTH domain